MFKGTRLGIIELVDSVITERIVPGHLDLAAGRGGVHLRHVRLVEHRRNPQFGVKDIIIVSGSGFNGHIVGGLVIILIKRMFDLKLGGGER